MLNVAENRVLYYFNEISKIPRESGNERAVSSWIAEWAKAKGFKTIQDENFNLIITKPAATGYEDHEPVILQAHMDMVCEKTPDSNHDFARDPIELKVDGDWFTSACGTSLGADNGIGVACAMTVLEDCFLKHPLIEAIFTVEEETTFKGAETVSPESFISKRMINLDHADDSEIIAGSCGGTGVNFTLPLEWEAEVPEGYEAYKLKVCGLKGGHSGVDIDKGRGNAIELLTRVLCSDNAEIKVVSVAGGTNRLAIPREAEAVILSNNEASLREHIAEMKTILRKEYGAIAPQLDITLEKTTVAAPLKTSELEKAIRIIRLIPNGIVNMCGAFAGIVESSNNLGMIDISQDRMFLTTEARGLYQSTVKDITTRIEMLAQLVGAEVELFGGYLPWEYTEESELRKTALKTYRELFGGEMKELIVHAGLECGAFVDKEPAMDIIAAGPNCQFFHSPEERVSISSIEKFYRFLTELLKDL